MKIREKIITVLITLLLFVCLCFTGQSVLRTAIRFACRPAGHTPPHSSDARETPAVGGTCGNNLRWTYKDGILTISGEGKMKDYKYSPAPWAASAITTVKIGEGVTGIGSRAFSRNKLLRHVLLPSTLDSISTDAFNRSEKLPGIYVARDNERFTSFAGVLFHKDSQFPAIRPVGNQRVSYPFPTALRQITSCIVFFVLYFLTAC